jgi:fumarate reductase subunit D
MPIAFYSMSYINKTNSTLLLLIEGWNSWYNVHHNITEMVVRQVADAMVSTGLAAAGYEYGIYFVVLHT